MEFGPRVLSLSFGIPTLVPKFLARLWVLNIGSRFVVACTWSRVRVLGLRSWFSNLKSTLEFKVRVPSFTRVSKLGVWIFLKTTFWNFSTCAFHYKLNFLGPVIRKTQYATRFSITNWILFWNREIQIEAMI